MNNYFALIAHIIIYKLLSLLPLVLMLIAIIKLHRNAKSPGTQLMLIGDLGLMVKLVLLDSIMDYLARFSTGINISSIGIMYNILHFISILFTILFAVGFLLFVIKLLKK